MSQDKTPNLFHAYGKIIKYESMKSKIVGTNDGKYNIACPDKSQRAINGILRACENLVKTDSTDKNESVYINQINYQIETYINRARTIKDKSKRLTDEQILTELNNALQKNESLTLEYFKEHVPSYKKFIDEFISKSEDQL